MLDFGRIKEFDTPANLLRRGDRLSSDGSTSSSPAPPDDDAIFAGLVHETGPQTREALRKLAFDAEAARLAHVDLDNARPPSPSMVGHRASWESDAAAVASRESSSGRRVARRGSSPLLHDASESPDPDAFELTNSLDATEPHWHALEQEEDDDDQGENDDNDDDPDAPTLLPAHAATDASSVRVQIE